MNENWVKRVNVAVEEDGSEWLPVSTCVGGDAELRKRPGRFRITSEFDFGRELMVVLSQIAITRCEHLFHSKELEYIGYSEHFRKIEEGEVIPEYIIVFCVENHRIAWFEFKERK